MSTGVYCNNAEDGRVVAVKVIEMKEEDGLRTRKLNGVKVPFEVFILSKAAKDNKGIFNMNINFNATLC